MIIPALMLVACCVGLPDMEKPINTVAALLCIMAIGSLSTTKPRSPRCVGTTEGGRNMVEDAFKTLPVAQ